MLSIGPMPPQTNLLQLDTKFRILGEGKLLNLSITNTTFIKMGEWLDNESAGFGIEEPWC